MLSTSWPREKASKEPNKPLRNATWRAFSVNREGGDVAAIKIAIKILEEAKHPLVIFPEGEIYHHMETLDELNEVASGSSGGAKLNDGKNGYVVPAAIRAMAPSRNRICRTASGLGKTNYMEAANRQGPGRSNTRSRLAAGNQGGGVSRRGSKRPARSTPKRSASFGKSGKSP